MTTDSPAWRRTSAPVRTETGLTRPRIRGRVLARVVRGPDTDPRWARPALLALLTATAVLYLWGLGASGWANSFYSAAVQAGSVSWKAFFYAASDAAGSITVDKTPASIWVMALSARLFGMNSWSLLVPQALMGVGTVALLHATVRRWYGHRAALLAGAVLALTPVAALMFRFNNPDALLVLLLVAAAYALVRALETASIRWLALVGVLVGLGFMTKMLQALIVVPVFALVYLLAAPTSLRRRVGQLLLAGVALVVSGGWWVAVVELVPASARPYIGGSQTNSVLELVLGYNGLGRLTGNETGSVGGGNGWGETGLLRLFSTEIGGQIAWLLPAALLLLLAGLVATRPTPRTGRERAGLLLWGGWLLLTGLVFSLMQGIFHAYYTVALAPAVAALVGIGAALAWQRRRSLLARLVLAAALAVTAVWGFVLLRRSPDFLPWLAYVVLLAGLVLAALLAAALPALGRRAAVLLAVVAIAVGLAAPAAYSVQTASQPHTGSIPSAGPRVAGAMGGPAGLGGTPPARVPQAPPGGMPGRQPGAAMGRGWTQQGAGPFWQGTPGAGWQSRGGMGGLLDGSTPSDELVELLEQDASSYTWVAAAVGSNNASGYQLATGDPVMAVGGFNGSDPSPTLAQFQEYVHEGRIHYFIGGRTGGPGFGRQQDGGSTSAEIAAWVADSFSATTVGGVQLYDLTQQ